MTNDLKTTLERIHKDTLAKFIYVSDLELHGVAEEWDMPAAFWRPGESFSGDCDDFAMHCREACKKLNLPTRLLLCYTETNECHLVAECHGYILDNRYPHVAANNSEQYKGYKWKYISGYNAGDPWTEVSLPV